MCRLKRSVETVVVSQGYVTTVAFRCWFIFLLVLICYIILKFTSHEIWCHILNLGAFFLRISLFSVAALWQNNYYASINDNNDTWLKIRWSTILRFSKTISQAYQLWKLKVWLETVPLPFSCCSTLFLWMMFCINIPDCKMLVLLFHLACRDGCDMGNYVSIAIIF